MRLLKKTFATRFSDFSEEVWIQALRMTDSTLGAFRIIVLAIPVKI